jgi:hypothetical protein
MRLIGTDSLGETAHFRQGELFALGIHIASERRVMELLFEMVACERCTIEQAMNCFEFTDAQGEVR